MSKPASKEYQGYTISLSEDWKGFEVKDWKSFDTYAQAVEAIDRRVAGEARVAKRKLSLNGIRKSGKSAVVTGVHSGNGNILSVPPTGRYDRDDDIYPAAGWVPELITELRSAQSRVDAIESILRDFEIKHSIDSYRFDSSKYPAAIAEVEKKYADVVNLVGSKTMADVLDARLKKIAKDNEE